MINNQKNIVEEIKRLEKQLLIEIQKKEEEFFYKVKGGKVLFQSETRKYHRTLATKFRHYLLNARLLNILTAPIIWSCIVPALLMDLFMSLFQLVCFSIYGIPKVSRRDYIVIDRQRLGYLNGVEKLNCVYCGYFNGLIAYVQEIAGRAEQYWCPIRHAKRLYSIHSRYAKFLEYGECEDYRIKIAAIRKDFGDLESASGNDGEG